MIKNLFRFQNLCAFSGDMILRVVTSHSYSPSAWRYIHWLFLLVLLAVMCIKPHTSPCSAILKNVFITDTLENIPLIRLHPLSLMFSFIGLLNLLKWIFWSKKNKCNSGLHKWYRESVTKKGPEKRERHSDTVNSVNLSIHLFSKRFWIFYKAK